MGLKGSISNKYTGLAGTAHGWYVAGKAARWITGVTFCEGIMVKQEKLESIRRRRFDDKNAKRHRESPKRNNNWTTLSLWIQSGTNIYWFMLEYTVGV